MNSEKERLDDGLVALLGAAVYAERG